MNATKERQARCCLQVKLCDPCLSALCVGLPWCKKALYRCSSFPFPFTRPGKPGGSYPSHEHPCGFRKSDKNVFRYHAPDCCGFVLYKCSDNGCPQTQSPEFGSLHKFPATPHTHKGLFSACTFSKLFCGTGKISAGSRAYYTLVCDTTGTDSVDVDCLAYLRTAPGLQVWNSVLCRRGAGALAFSLLPVSFSAV